MPTSNHPSDEACIAHYLQTMQAICPQITAAQLEAFSAELKVCRFRSREKIFEFGAIHQFIGFVIAGLVRSYYIDEKAEEKTSWFIPENEFVTDYPSFLTAKPSQFCFETLEPVTMVCLPKQVVYQGYDEHHAFERYGRLIAEAVIQMQQLRIESFLVRSAKERYLNFNQSYPQLQNRISVAHLASFIGIERQSLTRIRKELMLEE
jgi:CRP/FNR family transcriptional regulator, anaerobic regulatory protein